MQVDYNVSIVLPLTMDETAVWNNMVPEITVEATGAKDVPMKSTGHGKVLVSVCLIVAKLDET